MSERVKDTIRDVEEDNSQEVGTMEREQSGGGTIKCENRRTEKWTNGKTKGKKIRYDKRSKKKITKARQYTTQIWVYKIYVRKKRKKKK